MKWKGGAVADLLDFRIETFLVVCRTLNYTRAAEELALTQPAVSQHIAHLERLLGSKLFTYRNKRLALTEAGEELRRCAEGMQHESKLLARRLTALRSGRERFSVGMTLTAGEYILARPLAQWLALHPEVDVRVVQGDTKRLLALLEAGEVDFALIEGFFDRQRFDWLVLCREQLVGVYAPGHEAARLQRASWDDLLPNRLFVRERGSGTRAVLDHVLAANNLSVGDFARMTEVESINIIKTLVGDGLGIAFLYEAAVADELARGALARIDLAGAPIEHDITFVCHKDGVLRDRLRTMLAELAELYKTAARR